MTWENKRQLVELLNNGKYEDAVNMVLSAEMDEQAWDMFISGLSIVEDVIKENLELYQELHDKVNAEKVTVPSLRACIRFALFESLMYKLTVEKKLSENTYWAYFGTLPIISFSGWKLHIYGTTIEDSAFIANQLLPLVKKYQFPFKVACQGVINLATGNPEHIQYGKAAAIYIPPKIFQEGKLEEIISDLIGVFSKYKTEGTINGSNSINGKIHYRWELDLPSDPAEPKHYRFYESHYRDNDGIYNIPDNPDPFLNLKVYESSRSIASN